MAALALRRGLLRLPPLPRDQHERVHSHISAAVADEFVRRVRDGLPTDKNTLMMFALGLVRETREQPELRESPAGTRMEERREGTGHGNHAGSREQSANAHTINAAYGRADASGKVKILFVSANPAMTSRLALDEELRGIQGRIREAPLRDLIEMQIAPAARPEDLELSLLEHTPVIVHFSGHGSGTPGLVFQGDIPAKTKLFPADALRHLFQLLRFNVRVVVLNACYSQAQAEAIAHEIDFVVGMRESISDEAARAFAASFYRGLAFGQTVATAFGLGVNALKREELAEDEDAPVLLIRPGASGESVLFGPTRGDARAPGELPGNASLRPEDQIQFAWQHRQVTETAVRIHELLVEAVQSLSAVAGSGYKIDTGPTLEEIEHLTVAVGKLARLFKTSGLFLPKSIRETLDRVCFLLAVEHNTLLQAKLFREGGNLDTMSTAMVTASRMLDEEIRPLVATLEQAFRTLLLRETWGER